MREENTRETVEPGGAGISRRTVLGWAALSAVGAGIAGTGVDDVIDALHTAGQQTVVKFGMVRAEDQLDLLFSLYNLTLKKAGEAGPGDVNTARLVISDTGFDAIVVVSFPGQSVGERAFYLVDPKLPGQAGDESHLLARPIPAALAAASNLSFRVPKTAGAIPFTIEALLHWDGLAQIVVPAAQRAVPSTPPGPQDPGAQQTRIELPWRLVLSPDDAAGWAHSTTPVSHDGQRTELWHTRLGERRINPDGTAVVDEGAGRSVRAVWATGMDGAPTDPTTPGRTSLTHSQRAELVRISSDHTVSRPNGARPKAIPTKHLMLSSFGGWLDADGEWSAAERPAGTSIEEWRHVATMGRDHYVRVVQAGFLFPFGHRASLVTITERMFQKTTAGTHRVGHLAAYNRQRSFIIVREPHKAFTDVPNQPHGGRAMPFAGVRLISETTPNLAPYTGAGADPLTRVGDGGPMSTFWGADAFWPVVPSGQGSQLFHFACEGEDVRGRRTHFTAPLMFVSAKLSNDSGAVQTLLWDYYFISKESRRRRPLSGQDLALTPNAPDVTHPVLSIELGATKPWPVEAPLDAATQPRFFPVVHKLSVRLDAVESMGGGPAPAGAKAAAAFNPTGTPIEWHQSYLEGAANPGQVFAKLVKPVKVGFSPEAVGALVTPDLTITGLSSLVGPVGGELANLPQDFDPDKYFAGALPKILGFLPLPDIVVKAAFTALDRVPRLLKTELPDAIETSLVWKPELKTDPSKVFEPKDPQNGLELRVQSRLRRRGGTPSYTVTGELRNFAVNLLPAPKTKLITINFRSLRFSARDGATPQVDVDIADVVFRGDLAFLNPLQKFLASLPLPGLALKATAAPGRSGPFVDVTAEGIRAGVTLALPKVAVGVFSLENISLTTAVHLPFAGGPARLRFAFCDRERPFGITVAIFGGGGFCALELGLDGFERFEAALEFGARFSLDLGVASGGVSAMAGIYLSMHKDFSVLEGYLRINGRLRVLGLISVNTEFFLSLTYDSRRGELIGRARLRVSVDVAFFSTTVTLGPIEKRFAGGGGSSSASLKALSPVPTTNVEDLFTKSDWDDPAAGYCAQFAAAAFA